MGSAAECHGEYRYKKPKSSFYGCTYHLKEAGRRMLALGLLLSMCDSSAHLDSGFFCVHNSLKVRFLKGTVSRAVYRAINIFLPVNAS